MQRETIRSKKNKTNKITIVACKENNKRREKLKYYLIKKSFTEEHIAKRSIRMKSMMIHLSPRKVNVYKIRKDRKNLQCPLLH